MKHNASQNHQTNKFRCPRSLILVLLGLTVVGGGACGGSTKSRGTEGAPSADKGKILFYRNPMNPKITSPTPMKDEMGMDYVPVYENEVKKP